MLFFLFAAALLHAQDSLRQEASPGVVGKARALLQRSKAKANASDRVAHAGDTVARFPAAYPP